MRFFSPKEDKFLKENYLTMPAKRMAKTLGRREGTARQRMNLLGLIVPPEIIQKFKKDSQFNKGHQSFNKGRRQTEYMTAKAILKTKKTRFKKGGLPHNTKYDGAISIRTDKRGVKYKFIRVGLSNWMPMQRYIWQKKYGKIPKGGKIIFKDKNPMNLKMSNLELVNSSKLMKLNSVHNYPKPIALAVQLRGALNRQINSKLKTISNEK